MTALIRPFLDLIFFRGKVADIPASQSLLTLVALGCLLTDVLSSIKNAPFSTAFIIAAAQVVLLAGFLKLLLIIHKKPERWQQAITALFGVLTLLNLIAIPFSPKIETQDAATLTITPGLLLVALLQVWFFIVMARALKETLEIGMLRAVVLGFFLSYGIALVIITVFGGLLAPAAM